MSRRIAAGFLVDPNEEGSPRCLNPFVSVTGEPCDPTYYGFAIVGTGGGCTAWERSGPDGYVLITDGDLAAPTSMADGIDIGVYETDECAGECTRYVMTIVDPAGTFSVETDLCPACEEGEITEHIIEGGRDTRMECNNLNCRHIPAGGF